MIVLVIFRHFFKHLTHIKKSLIQSIALYLCFFILLACNKKDKVEVKDNPSNSGSHKVTGRVVDTNGNPVSGAEVSCFGKTAATRSMGQFLITDIHPVKNRIVVNVKSLGYFSGTATEIASSDGTTEVLITLMEAETIATLSSSTGGTASTSDGCSIEIPANGIVDENGNSYSGNVNVAAAYMDPTSPDFPFLIQGSDMSAREEDGSQVTLYSYGILRVELLDDNGNELQLSNGSSSVIRVNIPADMLSSAPATIPLWYFDEEEGMWKEDGFATKSGNQYIGTVSHFTDWNCDVPSPDQATISGKVVDCNGDPVPNIFVRTGQSYAFTDYLGNFTRRVPSGVQLTATVEPYWNNSLSSNTIDISPLAPGQNLNAGTLTLTTCPTTLKGKLIDCNNRAVSGWVKATSYNNWYYAYAEKGEFKLIVAPSESLDIYAYGDNGGFATMSTTTSSNAGIINNIGDFNICVIIPPVGNNKFTINGAGFSNQTINIQINDAMNNWNEDYYDYAIGYIYQYYDTSFNNGYYTDIECMGRSGLSNPLQKYVGFYLYITGDQPGSYSIPNNYIDIYITDENYSWIEGAYFYANSGTITLTRVDPPGGLIEGTFSGTFYDYYDYNEENPVTITNGTFSVVRYPEYAFKKSSKTPTQIIREQLKKKK